MIFAAYRLQCKVRALMLGISALSVLGGTAAAGDLAAALYAEGDWHGARAEGIRALAHDPDAVLPAMITALSALRIDPGNTEAAEELRGLARHAEEASIRTRSSYELGRIQWAAGDLQSAYDSLKEAFSQAEKQKLFLQSAHSLDVLLLRHPDVAGEGDPVRSQVRTVRPLITPAIREASAAPARDRGGRFDQVARRFVRFYQTQISPAIGARCSMQPSCSSYCLEASHTYGLAAIPMIADRLIRETDHVNYRINPVEVNGVEKYYDPPSHHTFWFRRYR